MPSRIHRQGESAVAGIEPDHVATVLVTNPDRRAGAIGKQTDQGATKPVVNPEIRAVLIGQEAHQLTAIPARVDSNRATQVGGCLEGVALAQTGGVGRLHHERPLQVTRRETHPANLHQVAGHAHGATEAAIEIEPVLVLRHENAAPELANGARVAELYAQVHLGKGAGLVATDVGPTHRAEPFAIESEGDVGGGACNLGEGRGFEGRVDRLGGGGLRLAAEGNEHHADQEDGQGADADLGPEASHWGGSSAQETYGNGTLTRACRRGFRMGHPGGGLVSPLAGPPARRLATSLELPPLPAMLDGGHAGSQNSSLLPGSSDGS